jgi:uncharacterized repeat protein (TIGR03803 family)
MYSTRACSAVAAVSSAFLAFLLSLSLVAQPTQAQTFHVLYNFAGSSDGGKPDAGLVRDAAGNLYGTATSTGAFGWGVAFKVDSSGTETVLHSFGDGTKDGRTPYAELIRDQAGNLYGTTYEGGGIGCTDGCGTVFKINKAGKETVLHRFAGGTADGCFPYGGLIRDSAANLYGTAQSCGASNFGTVFKLNKTGKETIVHSFAGGTTDGEYPTYTTLLMDAGGTLYGVTQQGGTTGGGIVYKLTQKGKETVLYSFLGGNRRRMLCSGNPVHG